MKNEILFKKFYQTSHIPLSILDAEGNQILSIPNNIQIVKAAPEVKENPYFFQSESNAYYCCIQLDKKQFLYLGPIFNTPVSENLVKKILAENLFPQDYQRQVASILYATPRQSFTEFFNHVTFLYFLLFNKEIEEKESYNPSHIPDEIEKNVIDSITQNKENQTYHNSYDWENQLYSVIKSGNVTALKSLLTNQIEIKFTEGVMASEPLRQSKNIFIGTVTKIGMLAAIPGGMDIEEVYYLIDAYTYECEQLNNVRKINQLHFDMALDFCRRISESRLPTSLSKEIHMAVQYINNHTNAPIRLEDVANYINRSKSFLIQHFKNELDTTPNHYIQKSKLQEGKRLLQFTTNSISDISYYLCFSSQSYFQNSFKKEYGMTPLEYRKQKQTVDTSV